MSAHLKGGSRGVQPGHLNPLFGAAISTLNGVFGEEVEIEINITCPKTAPNELLFGNLASDPASVQHSI